MQFFIMSPVKNCPDDWFYPDSFNLHYIQTFMMPKSLHAVSVLVLFGFWTTCNEFFYNAG